MVSTAQRVIAFDLSIDKNVKSFSDEQKEELKSKYDEVKFNIPCGMVLTSGERKSRFIKIDKTITDFSLDHETASQVMSKSEKKQNFLTATIGKSKDKKKVFLTLTYTSDNMETTVETDDVDANVEVISKSFSEMINNFCK